MTFLGFYGLALCLVCVYFVLSKWNEIRYRAKFLPPGTMGWPFFGENSQFLKYGLDYIKDRRAKYGSVFKSHVLGCPTIVVTDPQLIRYILLNEGKGIVPGYPQSMVDVMGKTNISGVYGSTHKLIRGSLLSLIGHAAIKDQLFPGIDKCMRCFIDNWDGKIIDIQEKTTEMAFSMTLRQIIQDPSDPIYRTFQKEFLNISAGTLTLPINFPGTSYYKGLRGRKKIIRILKQIVAERRASSTAQEDILAELLGNERTKFHLNEEQIFDQVFTMLHSGYETVSTTSMMTLKYLHDHPKILEELREEHLALRERKRPEEPIDWNAFNSMRFTRAVILEASRLASIVNGVLRKTVKDVELNGFIIPKGWRIYVSTTNINYDPLHYPEPFKFNPWRWLANKSLESHNYCFLFGGGTRQCPGKEFGMFLVSSFLHYFVIRYRWEQVEEVEFLKFPRVEAPKGLHIRVSKY